MLQKIVLFMNKQVTMKNVIIMGSSGDLAFKKIYPALNHINQEVNIILYCNTKSEETLKKKIAANKTDFVNIENRITIIPGSYQNLQNISTYLKSSVVYLSLPPSLYLGVLEEIVKYGGGFVAIEKPFGDNHEDFRMIYELIKENPSLKCVFIDHFITKFLPIRSIDLLQTEPYISLLNSKYVEFCHIAIKENITANKRKYFDNSGTIKDMLTNHLIQYFTTFAGERERIEDVLKQTTIDKQYSLFGQYEGYKEEMENPQTNTETFALVVLKINTQRWLKTHFLLYSGKSMEAKDYRVVFKFKKEKIKEICEKIKFKIKENLNSLNLVFEILEEIIYFEFDNEKVVIFDKNYATDKSKNTKYYDYEGIFYSLIHESDDFPFVNIQEISCFWEIFKGVKIDPSKLLIYKKGHDFEPEIKEIERKIKK